VYKDHSLNRGDVVEVFRYVIDGFRVREDWKVAVVQSVEWEQFEVKALKGTFDGVHEYLILPRQGKGKLWR
jgi:hypothetical protein